MKTRFVKEQGLIKWLGQPVELMFGLVANGEYTLEIKKKVKKRTVDQNALMWMWFTCIEDETGTLKQDVHDYYCKKFLRRVVSFNGKEEVVVRTTSKLNTAEMTTFLNKVQADAAAEFGIRLPSPDDQFFNAFTNRYEHIRY